MFTAVLCSLLILTLIHVGSPYYQNKRELSCPVLRAAGSSTRHIQSLFSAGGTGQPRHSPKVTGVTGRGRGCVWSLCVYSEHHSLQGLFAVPLTDVGMSFPNKSSSPNQYCKYLLPSLLHIAAVPESPGKQRVTTGFYEALHDQQL